jgi:hypothetical protein
MEVRIGWSCHSHILVLWLLDTAASPAAVMQCPVTTVGTALVHTIITEVCIACIKIFGENF